MNVNKGRGNGGGRGGFQNQNPFLAVKNPQPQPLQTTTQSNNFLGGGGGRGFNKTYHRDNNQFPSGGSGNVGIAAGGGGIASNQNTFTNKSTSKGGFVNSNPFLQNKVGDNNNSNRINAGVVNNSGFPNKPLFPTAAAPVQPQLFPSAAPPVPPAPVAGGGLFPNNNTNFLNQSIMASNGPSQLFPSNNAFPINSISANNVQNGIFSGTAASLQHGTSSGTNSNPFNWNNNSNPFNPTNSNIMPHVGNTFNPTSSAATLKDNLKSIDLKAVLGVRKDEEPMSTTTTSEFADDLVPESESKTNEIIESTEWMESFPLKAQLEGPPKGNVYSFIGEEFIIGRIPTIPPPQNTL
jgi:hypothetical protein